MTCFATGGFPEVALRCVDMVSDGFQRGFRGVSEGPKPRIFICGLRCLYVSFCIGAQKCHFAWFKSVLTTCLTGLEMVDGF